MLLRLLLSEYSYSMYEDVFVALVEVQSEPSWTGVFPVEAGIAEGAAEPAL